MQTDSGRTIRKGNRAFSVESVGYEFNSYGYRAGSRGEPGGALALFLGDSFTGFRALNVAQHQGEPPEHVGGRRTVLARLR